MHFFAPGVQAPVHAPVAAAQTNMQAEPESFHDPVLSQICGCRPLHFFASGLQTPLQLPPLHTLGQAAPLSFQLPVASQVWG